MSFLGSMQGSQALLPWPGGWDSLKGLSEWNIITKHSYTITRCDSVTSATIAFGFMLKHHSEILFLKTSYPVVTKVTSIDLEAASLRSSPHKFWRYYVSGNMVSIALQDKKVENYTKRQARCP